MRASLCSRRLYFRSCSGVAAPGFSWSPAPRRLEALYCIIMQKSYFQKKLQKYVQLRRLMAKNDKEYKERLEALTFLKGVKSMHSAAIRTVTRNAEGTDLVLVCCDKLTDSADLQFITVMEELLPKSKAYSLLLLLDQEEIAFAHFKNLICGMPTKYFAVLQQLFIVGASLSLRVSEFFSSNYIHKYLRKRTVCLAKLKAITGYGFELQPLVKTLKDPPKEKQTAKEEDKVLLQSFKGVDLYALECNKEGVPLVVQALVQYFEKRPEVLDRQGVFRKGGVIDEIAQLEHELVLEHYQILNSDLDSNTVSSLFKKLLQNCREVFSQQFQQALAQVVQQSGEARAKLVQQLIRREPKERQAVLRRVAGLLAEVAKREKTNLMTARNLSICFAPCFLRNWGSAATEIGRMIVLVETLILQYKLVFELGPKPLRDSNDQREPRPDSMSDKQQPSNQLENLSPDPY